VRVRWSSSSYSYSSPYSNSSSSSLPSSSGFKPHFTRPEPAISLATSPEDSLAVNPTAYTYIEHGTSLATSSENPLAVVHTGYIC
jgi:hypothetical protein